MSSLSRNIQHFKTLLYQGSDLMVLRLRMLALDLNAQAGGVLRIMGAIVFAAVMALLGLVSLLFGLNSVLAPHAKVWVFFGITAASLLAVAGLLMWAAGHMAQPRQPGGGHIARHAARHRLSARPDRRRFRADRKGRTT